MTTHALLPEQDKKMTPPPEAELKTEKKDSEQSVAGKLLIEIGPLLVFFGVNAAYGIFAGTGAFMVATVLSLGTAWLLYRKVPFMPVLSAVLVLAFGGLTLYFNDDTFFKMKPTIVNTLFGTILLGGLAFDRPLLGYVFDSVFQLDEEGWRKLTFRWAIFFLALAILNEVIWRNFSRDFWVSFKVFGMMPITLVFTMFQMPLIMRHSLEEPDDETADKADAQD